MRTVWLAGLAALLCMTAQAAEIVVSWETNGVLVAEGMEPGTTYSVEWTSSLDQSFTNGTPAFDGVTDSNGMVHVQIPMFFRVSGTPKIPEGMVPIPAGTNSGTDPDFGAYSLTNESAFYMDATEVTKLQWDAVYSWAVTNGYSFDNAGLGKATNHPVHTVNWYDCVKWCNARSEKEGRTPCYTVGGSVYKTGQSSPNCDFDVDGFRLPTSDEWEYAARGGLFGNRFPWGDTITHSNANYYSSSLYSYDTSSTRGHHPDYDDGGEPYTSPVGDFLKNGYDLYDMAGNVWEWCWGLSVSSGYVRGGGWDGLAPRARCADEYWRGPDYAGKGAGFRAVCR